VKGRSVGVITVTGHTKEKINACGILVGKHVVRRPHGSLVVHGRIILK
jgi:hypothetical protein